jgi:hypothetical protein
MKNLNKEFFLFTRSRLIHGHHHNLFFFWFCSERILVYHTSKFVDHRVKTTVCWIGFFVLNKCQWQMWKTNSGCNFFFSFFLLLELSDVEREIDQSKSMDKMKYMNRDDDDDLE